MNSHHYKDFPHSAEELSAYMFCIDTFVLSLKSEEVVRYVADDPPAFIAWLQQHGIRDVKAEVGKLIYNHYFEKQLKE